MKRIICLVVVVFFIIGSLSAGARVKPVSGGYEVSYNVVIPKGTSNGNDIQDVVIFEWNEFGHLNVEGGFSIKGKGHTNLSHVIGFEPESALVFGWGAAVSGVGDEKDHLFTLANSSFTRQITGKKWSEAFPGVAPVPRTGHNALIGLVRAASGGDSEAVDDLTAFIRREAETAAFDPAKGFRVIEWSVGHPIDTALPVPALSFYGMLLLILGFVAVSRRAARVRVRNAFRTR